jgi:hypothetical protein
MSGLVSGLSESGDLLGRCLCGWTGPRVSATALSVHVGVLSGLSWSTVPNLKASCTCFSANASSPFRPCNNRRQVNNSQFPREHRSDSIHILSEVHLKAVPKSFQAVYHGTRHTDTIKYGYQIITQLAPSHLSIHFDAKESGPSSNFPSS